MSRRSFEADDRFIDEPSLADQRYYRRWALGFLLAWAVFGGAGIGLTTTEASPLWAVLFIVWAYAALVVAVLIARKS
jgi:hypothetical protein